MIRTTLPGAHRLRDGRSVYWWIELSLILVIALIVVLVAPMFRSPTVPPEALPNAVLLVRAERFLALFQEHPMQRWAIALPPVVVAANWWYGLMHFVVTAATFIWLFRRHPDDYPLWRNTLAASSLIAIVTQALWPATPPRLLHGAAATPAFVDTLARYSTPWAFTSGGTSGVANQFAAMPSMHCVWALWVACVLVPRMQHRWMRWCAAIYPVITLVVIVFTGNHFIVDAFGGYAALGIGYLIARGVTRAGRRPAESIASAA